MLLHATGVFRAICSVQAVPEGQSEWLVLGASNPGHGAAGDLAVLLERVRSIAVVETPDAVHQLWVVLWQCCLNRAGRWFKDDTKILCLLFCGLLVQIHGSVHCVWYGSHGVARFAAVTQQAVG